MDISKNEYLWENEAEFIALDNEQKMLLLNYKKFFDKHAEKVGGAGTIIPLVYWLLIWQKINFSDFNFLFIVLYENNFDDIKTP